MSHFYILIKNKENKVFLKDTALLIKKYCLKDSNKFSITLNKHNHSNCTLDSTQVSHLQVYDTNKNEYEEYIKNYKTKYNINNQDLEMLLRVYGSLNIEEIEELRVQVKITYNLNFINALQFIIDLLGINEPLNSMYDNKEGELFNQVIINELGADCAIVENNYIYSAIFENGCYIKQNIIDKNDMLIKYNHYKKLDKIFSLKNKKEIQKI